MQPPTASDYGQFIYAMNAIQNVRIKETNAHRHTPSGASDHEQIIYAMNAIRNVLIKKT